MSALGIDRAPQTQTPRALSFHPHLDSLSLDKAQLYLANLLSGGFLLTISVTEVQTVVAVVVGISLVVLNAVKALESIARRKESEARTEHLEESEDLPETPDNDR